MNAIYTIPSYLPEGLKKHVEPQFKYDQSLKVVNPLERLITHFAMKKVWDTLATLCPSITTIEQEKKKKELDSQPLIDFLTTVTGHSSLFGEFDDYIALPSDNVQRKAYRSIQKNIESIIATLQSLSKVKSARKDTAETTIFKQGSIQEGWHILDGAIRRCEITTLESNTTEQSKQIAELIFSLNCLNEQQSIQEILETMMFAAIAASQAKDSNLPKRRNTSEAKTNSFILYLSEYFMSRFNEPFDELVAITTNTAFGFDDEITENKVYKLRHPSKPKPKSKTAN